MSAQIIPFRRKFDPSGYYVWRFLFEREHEHHEPGGWERFKDGRTDPAQLAVFAAIEHRYRYAPTLQA